VNKPIPFGKYYLLERINVGGMAEVFRAKAFGVEGFERLVAVKRILPNIAEDKEFIRMFIDEAKIAVQLNHANIAQIFDLGMVEGAYYIALEHVHGRDLRAIFDRCRNQSEPMPVAQACFIGMKVCEGLDYAHNKRDQAGRELNLVHRDVSPQNILVSFEGEVKLIDFGIAKAAGKGSKTQAGILKGKFGYMSPEQVRGLPIDRRSDVFSCGIVLYELLTGERLFVGESDFSTLEKVRNVEILPPSTYNRKIPDELERIVLKALAKDVDDRYSNAIDLHDELQAFVYTAGEFYSRKDLAGWMKARFAREIDEETRKLEEYRQLRPPEARAPQTRRPMVPDDGPRQSTLSMPAVRHATRPPPIPPASRRSSASMPAMAAAPAVAAPGYPGVPPDDLDWDEDELETAIYDDQMARPASVGPGMANVASDPNMSDLPVEWGGEPPPMLPGPDQLADGSNKRPAPMGPGPMGGPPLLGPSIDEVATVHQRPRMARDSSVAASMVSMGDRERRVPMSSFGESLLSSNQPRRTGMAAAIAALVVLLAGGGVALYVLLSGGEDPPAAVAANAGGAVADDKAEPAAGTAVSGSGVDPNTGFDLIVEPSNVKVKLDGRELATKPPLQIRNLSAGEHIVEITAPPGFFNKTQKVQVEAGKAPRVNIELDAMEIAGRFISDPPGAEVTLVAGSESEPLGRSPAEASLDPRKRYEVMFRKSGYVTVTRPVDLGAGEKVEVAVELERARSERVAERDRRKEPRVAAAVPVEPEREPEPAEDEGADSGDHKKFGFIAIGSKPPCKIFIDGRDTGLRTPRKDIRLSAGKHRVTLINNEHGIKESFSVRIKAGQTARAIKDWSDRIK
jgi:serine/threonine protein kinase